MADVVVDCWFVLRQPSQTAAAVRTRRRPWPRAMAFRCLGVFDLRLRAVPFRTKPTRHGAPTQQMQKHVRVRTVAPVRLSVVQARGHSTRTRTSTYSCTVDLRIWNLDLMDLVGDLGHQMASSFFALLL